MQILAFLVAFLLWLGLIAWIRATVDFCYCRREENDHIEINISALKGIWKSKISIPTLKLEWEEGPKIETEQKAQAPSGEKRKAFSELKFRFIRRGFFYELFPNIPNILREFNLIKKKFYKGITCTLFDWEIEYGHENPAVTALTVGGFWGMLGYSLARITNQVTMETNEPRIMVVPHFKKPGFICNIQCKFNLRIGHILFVGLDLGRMIIRRIRG